MSFVQSQVNVLGKIFTKFSSACYLQNPNYRESIVIKHKQPYT